MTVDVRPVHDSCSLGIPSQADRDALDHLMPLVYPNLRRMAAAFLRRERPDHTLQPTALANEVYLRFAAQRNVNWRDPAQVLGLAAQIIRRILVNHAEAYKAAKRGSLLKIPLNEEVHAPNDLDQDILSVNDALTSLAALDPEKSRIVELRFFAGLTMQEISTVVGKSLASVEREWTLARAWLYRELCRK